jgi:hypothetical protein
MKRLKGSLSIEAILSVSLMLIIMTLILGALISIYIDENMQWSVMQTKDDLSLAYMPFIGHDQSALKIVEQSVLTTIADHRLNQNINSREMNRLVSKVFVAPVEKDQLGFIALNISYKYIMPSFVKKGEMIIPTVAAAFSDGVDFDSQTVYITTYGEKYHRPSCFHLRKSKFGIALSEAKIKGYDACKNCHNQSQKEE